MWIGNFDSAQVLKEISMLLQIGSRSVALRFIELLNQDRGAGFRCVNRLDSREYSSWASLWPAFWRTWTATTCPLACQIEAEFLSYSYFNLLWNRLSDWIRNNCDKHVLPPECIEDMSCECFRCIPFQFYCSPWNAVSKNTLNCSLSPQWTSEIFITA